MIEFNLATGNARSVVADSGTVNRMPGDGNGVPQIPTRLANGPRLEAMTRDKGDAGRLARWLLRLEKLRLLDLAEPLRVEAGDEEEEQDVAHSHEARRR